MATVVYAAARTLFVERGVGALLPCDVAALVGMPAAVVTQRWPTAAGLVAAVVSEDVSRPPVPWSGDAPCSGGWWSCARKRVDDWSVWHGRVAAHPMVEQLRGGPMTPSRGAVEDLWAVVSLATERFLQTLPACWAGDAVRDSKDDVEPLHDALARAMLSLLITPAPADRPPRLVAAILRSLSKTHGVVC